MDTDLWGIDDEYYDMSGTCHRTTPETRSALHRCMGISDGDTPGDDAPLVVRGCESPRLEQSCELRLEDGTTIGVVSELPPDLPIGYHELRPEGSERTRMLIVAPSASYLPPGLREWGWAVSLYAARSSKSWGFGDLGDLRWLADWSLQLGAGSLLVNPLAAPCPVLPQNRSPYFPASRCFRNPLYIRIEEVPNAASLGPELDQLAAVGRSLNERDPIDYDEVFRVKYDALRRIWERTEHLPELDAFLRGIGPHLWNFAVYSAIAEKSGCDWRAWKQDLRRPGTAAVAGFSEENASRVRFHIWLQWILDMQLRRASENVHVIHDLPIGIDVAGPDAWTWQDSLALGARVGAPADPARPDGQNWGVVPLVPHRLRQAKFEPFITTLRLVLRHAGGIRIDHAMGLFRLFWIPEGSTARAGGYVRYPCEELLAILAVESHRAHAVVIGEDLGTVESGVRDRMSREKMLGCRLLYFETDVPNAYPEYALGSTGNHDLPTLSGLWTRADLEHQRSAGLSPDELAFEQLRSHVARIAGVQPDATSETLVREAYGVLGSAPCALILAQIEDAFLSRVRPNMPGAPPDYPNWAHPLPRPIEVLDGCSLADQIALALARPEKARAA